MKVISTIVVVSLILYVLFRHLLEQSKRPTGWIGSLMMKLWNCVYLPMAIGCLSFLTKKKFTNVLDIGVGNGATTAYNNNFICQSVIGIDISEKAIGQANASHLKSNLTFERKDIAETGYPSNHFDLICAFQNHFHWRDLQGSFLEIRRMLSDDGILLIGCEYSKIKYYLHEFKSEKDFSLYLGNLKLNLVQVEQKKD